MSAIQLQRGAGDIERMNLFRGCFSPSPASKGTRNSQKASFGRDSLKDRWKQYDGLSKEDTWGTTPVLLLFSIQRNCLACKVDCAKGGQYPFARLPACRKQRIDLVACIQPLQQDAQLHIFLAQAPAPGIIHIHAEDKKGTKEPPKDPKDSPAMRKTFSKGDLKETWDFYQETQGPKILESLPENERQVF